MKYFLFTIGLHNNDKGIWFDDVIVKGPQVPDHLDLIEVLKSRYFSKIIGVTGIKEVQYEKNRIQVIVMNR
ncbi:hypothetical protein [Emticicia aquatilis]|nr:hypothetical protein [Emticicia aquatilis]